MLQSHCGSLVSVLTPPVRRKEVESTKSCGRVLTSVENLKAIEEKETAKKEKIRQKEERKQRMEQKKQEKAKEAEQRKQKAQARKLAKEAKKCTTGKKGKDVSRFTFTDDEIKKFEIRFQNGFDLRIDERYNAWLETKCSQNVSSRKCPKVGTQLQNDPPIDSLSLSLLHCPSALELSPTAYSTPPIDDRDESVSPLTTLYSENEPLNQAGKNRSCIDIFKPFVMFCFY